MQFQHSAIPIPLPWAAALPLVAIYACAKALITRYYFLFDDRVWWFSCLGLALAFVQMLNLWFFCADPHHPHMEALEIMPVLTSQRIPVLPWDTCSSKRYYSDQKLWDACSQNKVYCSSASWPGCVVLLPVDRGVHVLLYLHTFLKLIFFRTTAFLNFWSRVHNEA